MAQLHAYAVTLVFAEGPIVTNVLLSPSAEAATAMLFSEFVRGPNGVPKEPLTGVAVCPISLEWLRLAIQNEAPAQVVRLVPRPEAGQENDGPICPLHGCLLAAGRCLVCEPPGMPAA